MQTRARHNKQNGKKWRNDRTTSKVPKTVCHAPTLIGYPKIDKKRIPLRGVISTIGSPYERISRVLKPILKSLQGRSGEYVKNSKEQKERVKEWRIERDGTMVRYDVINLYPSIPMKKALDLVQELLMSKSLRKTYQP